MSKITYGTHTIDTSTLPETSVNSLLTKGLAHFLGNEQSSKATSWMERETAARAKDGKPAPTAEDKAAALAQFVTDAKAALVAGTVGASVRGPRGSAVETIQRALAKAEVIVTLSSLQPKVKFPKGEETVQFSDGTKLTGEQLIARRLAKHGERLMKEAEAKMKADARKADKLAEGAKGLSDIDALDA